MLYRQWSLKSLTSDDSSEPGNFLCAYAVCRGEQKVQVYGQDCTRSYAELLIRLLIANQDELKADDTNTRLIAMLHGAFTDSSSLPGLPKQHDTFHFQKDVSKEHAGTYTVILEPSIKRIFDSVSGLSTSHPSFSRGSDKMSYTSDGEVTITPGLGATSVECQALPIVGDFLCNRRKLYTSESFYLQDADIISSRPMSHLPLGLFANEVSAQVKISKELPFDISEHPDAKSPVAQKMLARLAKDMILCSHKLANGSTLLLDCLVPEVAEKLSLLARGGMRLPLHEALSGLRLLERALLSTRASDIAFSRRTIEAVEKLAMQVPASLEATVFGIGIATALEAPMRFSFLTGAIMSSDPAAELRSVNPHLTQPQVEEILAKTIAALFRCNRIAQCDFALYRLREVIRSVSGAALYSVSAADPGDAYDLRDAKAVLNPSENQSVPWDVEVAVERLRGGRSAESATVGGLSGTGKDQQLAMRAACFREEDAEAILSDADKVAMLRSAASRGCWWPTKHGAVEIWEPAVVDKLGQLTAKAKIEAALTAAGQGCEATSGVVKAKRHYVKEGFFDPRFLVFEYRFGFLLRRRQVELVTEFVESALRGESRVHQMIMGAGKTTVIGPLLALMLADGNSLVTQMVPTALLEMSIGVMRECFSGIITKRVLSLRFQRTSADNITEIHRLYNHLDRARKERAIVCTTPEVIKSLMLKYVEFLVALHLAAHPEQEDQAPERNARRSDGLARMKGLYDAYKGGSNDRSKEVWKEMMKRASTADALGKVMRLFGPEEKGVLMLDEVDLILHPLRSELNFPIGQKSPYDLGENRWLLPTHLLDLVFFASTGRICAPNFVSSPESEELVRRVAKTVQEGFNSLALQRTPHLVLLSPDFYQHHLKELVAEWAYMWLILQKQVNQQRPEKGFLLTYLMATGDQANNLVTSLQGQVPDDEGRSLVNLARDWCCQYLPHVLTKINRVKCKPSPEVTPDPNPK